MKPDQSSSYIVGLCANSRVITTLTADNLSGLDNLAEELVAAGLPVIEVLLRTPQAMDAISILAAVPGCVVAAGSVLTPQQLVQAKSLGASFAVSPGATDSLISAAAESGLPLLPGAATASEVMRLCEHGFDFMKFFPAVPSGGVSALKALGGPMPHIRFCPTGGINADNFERYLYLTNVTAVGGSWLVNGPAFRLEQWSEVGRAARRVARQANAQWNSPKKPVS